MCHTEEFLDKLDVRTYNQYRILSHVYSRGTTSRTALAKELKLSKPAIADNLERLIQNGIIKEVGEGKSARSGGRRPRLLQYDGSGRYVIAIDLNLSKPLFIIGDLNNEVLCEFDITIEPKTSMESCQLLVENGINLLLSSKNLKSEDLFCICLSSPGFFDSDGNLFSSNPQYCGFPWANIDFKQFLVSRFNVPVIIQNDVFSATIGEWERGWHKSEDMLFIECGVGVGAGIILDGKLFKGKHNTAGTIYNYLDSCSVKGEGKLEERVCINTLLSTLQNAYADKKNNDEKMVKKYASFPKVVEAFQKGDPLVVEKVRNIGRELAVVAFNCTTFLSIRSIIFGGEYDVFANVILDEMNKVFMACGETVPTIHKSRLGRYAGIHGMLSLAREHYFQELCSNKR